jgi:hypothetical protein
MQEKELPKGDQDQTLWDGEELALKFILEDGKLNLYVFIGETANRNMKHHLV